MTRQSCTAVVGVGLEIHSPFTPSLQVGKCALGASLPTFYPSSPPGNLGQLLNHSVPWFPALQNGENKNPCKRAPTLEGDWED